MSTKNAVAYEDAVKRLPDGETVHTFRQGSGPVICIGGDWPREELLEAMQKYGVQEAGPVAFAMGHGLALCDDVGWLFIQTQEGDGER